MHASMNLSFVPAYYMNGLIIFYRVESHRALLYIVGQQVINELEKNN